MATRSKMRPLVMLVNKAATFVALEATRGMNIALPDHLVHPDLPALAEEVEAMMTMEMMMGTMMMIPRAVSALTSLLALVLMVLTAVWLEVC